MMAMEPMDSSDSEGGDAQQARATATGMAALSSSYSSALTKSMRAMISGNRLRGKRSQQPELPSPTRAADERDDQAQAVAAFADAIARKDKEAMLDALARWPTLPRQPDQDGRLPLHLVCALRPNYRFVDVMTMVAKTHPDAAGCADKNGQTPMHVLCENSYATAQALGMLAGTLAASVSVLDSRGNLPLHYLCRNPACDVGAIRQLGDSDASYSAVNDDGQTALHCVTTAPQLNKSVLVYLLEKFPDAAFMVDTNGRAPLHCICEHVQVDIVILRKMLDAAPDCAARPDGNHDLPLHLLCENEKLNQEMLHLVLAAYPTGVYSLSENNLSPLHLLCSNESCTSELVAEVLAFDTKSSACVAVDMFGATPLHVLCMNESICADALRTMLLMCSEDALAQDVHGRSPLHYLCMNQAVSTELLWLFFDRGQELLRQLDKDERSPLHHLCYNTGVTPRVLEILFDACPSSALVADLELKLPVQYLVDNPSSSSETTALLISGPASYRHRYEFLRANAHCSRFIQRSELVYVQSNLALDSNSASKVLVKFYSSAQAAGHEHDLLLHLKAVAESTGGNNGRGHYAPSVIERFEDAKRRVALRNLDIAPEEQQGDAAVTLDYALVTEAPLYTLESLGTEGASNSEVVRAIITEVAACLRFWHCEARVVHGNMVLENIGQFEDRGLCLFNLGTSRELHELCSIGPHGITLASCPPEAASVFLVKEYFTPTLASDMWQFGCLVYQLLTGRTLFKRLAPWIDGVGHNQALHLVCCLTEDVLGPIIAEVDPDFQLLLHRTLAIDPSHRWGIDRLMQNASSSLSFDASDSSSLDLVGGTLWQETEDALADSASGARAAKHVQDQLEFMKKEQANLRRVLLETKTSLRDTEQTEVQELQTKLTSVTQQKQEAHHEAQLLARNHQEMTLQLHTTVQMLLNLVPLAQKVHGPAADDFLSTALSQASGARDIHLNDSRAGTRPPRRNSAVQVVKDQLQHSKLAHGCVQKWANSSISTALASTEVPSSSNQEDEESSIARCESDGGCSDQDDSSAGNDEVEDSVTTVA